MSTILGTSSHQTAYAQFTSGSGYPNGFFVLLHMPAGGPWVISKLGVWAAAVGSASNAVLACWSGGGTLLGKSSIFSLPGVAWGRGNSQEQVHSLITPVTVAGGSSIFVGFVRDPAGSAQMDAASGGTTYQVVQDGTWPADDTGGSTWGHGISAWLYYDLADSPPNAPTLTSPVPGAKVDSSPTLTATGSDPDPGDSLAAYDLQVASDASFSTLLTNRVAQTTGISGWNITFPGAPMPPAGQTYYWRMRTKDSSGLYGAWSPASTYYGDRPPVAPALSSPANGARITTATPTLAASGSDPDSGDTMASYDLQVSTDSTFASVTHWNAGGQTAGISGWSVSRVYAGTALSRGTTYYWRMRMTDQGGQTGEWSAVFSFRYNALPTVSGRIPASAALAPVTNLTDTSGVWDSAGNAKAQLTFVVNDADGDAIFNYRIRIYNDSGGSPGTLKDDTGFIYGPWASGSTINFSTLPLDNGVQYWWSVDLYDGYEWMGESAKTAFKVRWAQGLFEADSGAASSSWAFATGAVVGSVGVLFRSASSSGGESATGKSAWYTTIGAVPKQEWLQVLVRLSTTTPGTSATLASMTFTYLGVRPVPDGWTTS